MVADPAFLKHGPTLVTLGDEILGVADSVCRALITKRGRRSYRDQIETGFIETIEVLGAKVRLIYRSSIDYSLGNDNWNIRFRKHPLPDAVILRGDADLFNKDMTVFKMVGEPYTLD